MNCSPSPWKVVRPAPDEVFVDIVDANGSDVVGSDGVCINANHDANVSLIRAAPELRAALEFLLRVLDAQGADSLTFAKEVAMEALAASRRPLD